MPQAVDAWKCPYCRTLHIDFDAYEDCVRTCARCSEYDTEEAWVCCKCRAVFSTRGGALNHEESCPKLVDKEKPGQETCLTCANGDAEGHRWQPCPENHFAPVRTACDRYVFTPK